MRFGLRFYVVLFCLFVFKTLPVHGQQTFERLVQQNFILDDSELNGVRRLYDQTETALAQVASEMLPEGDQLAARELVEFLSNQRDSLPKRIRRWAELSESQRRIPDIDVQELIYRLCVAQLIDDLSVAGGKGRRALRALLNRYAEQDLELKNLLSIVRKKNDGPLQLLVPWDQRHIDKANKRLEKFERTDLRLNLGQVVRFVQAEGTDEDAYTAPTPGSDAIAHARVSHFRNLLIPPLTFAAAFLGGMADYLQLAQDDPEAIRQVLQDLMVNISLPMGLGLGAGAIAHFGFRTDARADQIQNPVLRTGAQYLSELRGPIATAVITVFGVAYHYGPQAITQLAPALVVGTVASFLEWQFSKFSDWWTTHVWEIGAIERAFGAISGVNMDDVQSPFYRRMVRPAVGTASNFVVNTAYPAILEGSKFLALLLFVDSAMPSMDLGWDTLKVALNFTLAFGVFQIIIGNLRSQGELGETSRFRLETAAVIYNGAIARVLAVGMAVSTLGDHMMWGFAAVITAPAFVYFMGLPLIERFSSFYQRQLLSQSRLRRATVAPVTAVRTVAGAFVGAARGLAKACGFGKARKPVELASQP